MKSFLTFLAILLPLSTAIAQTDSVARLDQIHIVNRYLHATGRQPLDRTTLGWTQERPEDMPVKCGMSAIADFRAIRSKLDKDLLMAMGADTLPKRPVLDLSMLSRSGHFKIHYTKTGNDAAYQPDVDRDGNGIPDYVDKVADIADSVYFFMVDTLGFPPPPSDSFYSPQGDGQYDIYIHSLGNVYGNTYEDWSGIDTTGAGRIHSTSFIEIQNDFGYINNGQYRNRELDAVRVTLAHEFFHAVQFGMNVTDYEFPNRRYWMEMSAVWMEETQYTNINDYYSYLHYFFDVPTRSIQDFSGNGIHAYASVVFPLYLSSVYGRDIIKAIWLESEALGADLGPGARFLAAAQHAIDSASNHHANMATAFRDFALWNFFTGERSDAAPTGVGYKERSAYPAIPDSAMGTSERYPISLYNVASKYPELNAATYMRYYGIQAIQPHFFACGEVKPESLCTVRFVDTICAPRTRIPDSVITRIPLCHDPNPPTICSVRSGCSDTTELYFGPSFLVWVQVDTVRPGWGLTILNHPVDDPSRPVIDAKGFLPADTVSTYGIDLKKPGKTDAITLIFSTGSSDVTLYHPRVGRFFAWYVGDTTRTYPANSRATILDPYPNPAMNTDNVWFRFRVPTDSTSKEICDRQQTWMQVDLYTIAGERVSTIQSFASLENLDRNLHEYRIPWDMTNADGRAVSSGVYLAVGRLVCGGEGGSLLAVGKTKVAVIR